MLTAKPPIQSIAPTGREVCPHCRARFHTVEELVCHVQQRHEGSASNKKDGGCLLSWIVNSWFSYLILDFIKVGRGFFDTSRNNNQSVSICTYCSIRLLSQNISIFQHDHCTCTDLDLYSISLVLKSSFSVRVTAQCVSYYWFFSWWNKQAGHSICCSAGASRIRMHLYCWGLSAP